MPKRYVDFKTSETSSNTYILSRKFPMYLHVHMHAGKLLLASSVFSVSKQNKRYRKNKEFFRRRQGTALRRFISEST